MRFSRSSRSSITCPGYMAPAVLGALTQFLSLQQVVLASPAPAVQYSGVPLSLSSTGAVQYSASSSSSSDPRLGAVASESSLCSRIGTDLLQAGGNAADALVGTVLCIGVVAMYHSGIGGGGFMIVRAANGTKQVVDFRETAPAAAFENMYQGNVQGSITSGLASGVPGELRGLEYLHKNYGKLPWKSVVTPAVNVARNGWQVTADLVRYMASATSGIPDFLTNDPSWAIDFAPNGTRVKLNETITRKRYADTLETIGQYGADAFYTGAIANTTIRTIRANNGTMTLADLKNYTAAIRQPVSITYGNHILSSCGAPSSGEVVLNVLKVAEGYPDFGYNSSTNISYHRLDEAMRFGYGLRSQLGDPTFVKGADAYQQEMISNTTAAEIRSKITDVSHNVSYYDPSGLESLETPGTSHIVTADADGLSVSLTTTVNLLFGSQLIVPETGIILNNEMNDFSIPNTSNAFGFIPSPANFIRPGKRPLSSISPVIVEHLSNHSFYAAIGAAGGSRIITANIQTLWNLLDRNMTVLQSLGQPRLHDQLVPNNAVLEWAFDNGTAAFLRDRGHNVTYVAPGQSTAQGLRLLTNGTFEAAGEPRQIDSGGFAV